VPVFLSGGGVRDGGCGGGWELGEAASDQFRELRSLQDVRHHGSLSDYRLGSSGGRRRPELRRDVVAVMCALVTILPRPIAFLHARVIHERLLTAFPATLSAPIRSAVKWTWEIIPMADSRLACPSCFETRALRKSHFRTVDYIHLLFRRHPYRCLICNHRFYSHVQPSTRPETDPTA
jgi:hypothetical protein